MLCSNRLKNAVNKGRVITFSQYDELYYQIKIEDDTHILVEQTHKDCNLIASLIRMLSWFQKGYASKKEVPNGENEDLLFGSIEQT
jgi:hypothetical protein